MLCIRLFVHLFFFLEFMLQSRRAIEEETYANMSELPAEADQLELTLASISPLLGTSLSDISETCRNQEGVA